MKESKVILCTELAGLFQNFEINTSVCNRKDLKIAQHEHNDSIRSHLTLANALALMQYNNDPQVIQPAKIQIHKP